MTAAERAIARLRPADAGASLRPRPPSRRAWQVGGSGSCDPRSAEPRRGIVGSQLCSGPAPVASRRSSRSPPYFENQSPSAGRIMQALPCWSPAVRRSRTLRACKRRQRWPSPAQKAWSSAILPAELLSPRLPAASRHWESATAPGNGSGKPSTSTREIWRCATAWQARWLSGLRIGRRHRDFNLSRKRRGRSRTCACWTWTRFGSRSAMAPNFRTW